MITEDYIKGFSKIARDNGIAPIELMKIAGSSGMLDSIDKSGNGIGYPFYDGNTLQWRNASNSEDLSNLPKNLVNFSSSPFYNAFQNSGFLNGWDQYTNSVQKAVQPHVNYWSNGGRDKFLNSSQLKSTVDTFNNGMKSAPRNTFQSGSENSWAPSTFQWNSRTIPVFNPITMKMDNPATTYAEMGGLNSKFNDFRNHPGTMLNLDLGLLDKDWWDTYSSAVMHTTNPDYIPSGEGFNQNMPFDPRYAEYLSSKAGDYITAHNNKNPRYAPERDDFTAFLNKANEIIAAEKGVFKPYSLNPYANGLFFTTDDTIDMLRNDANLRLYAMGRVGDESYKNARGLPNNSTYGQYKGAIAPKGLKVGSGLPDFSTSKMTVNTPENPRDPRYIASMVDAFNSDYGSKESQFHERLGLMNPLWAKAHTAALKHAIEPISRYVEQMGDREIPNLTDDQYNALVKRYNNAYRLLVEEDLPSVSDAYKNTMLGMLEKYVDIQRPKTLSDVEAYQRQPIENPYNPTIYTPEVLIDKLYPQIDPKAKEMEKDSESYITTTTGVQPFTWMGEEAWYKPDTEGAKSPSGFKFDEGEFPAYDWSTMSKMPYTVDWKNLGDIYSKIEATTKTPEYQRNVETGAVDPRFVKAYLRSLKYAMDPYKEYYANNNNTTTSMSNWYPGFTAGNAVATPPASAAQAAPAAQVESAQPKKTRAQLLAEALDAGTYKLTYNPSQPGKNQYQSRQLRTAQPVQQMQPQAGQPSPIQGYYMGAFNNRFKSALDSQTDKRWGITLRGFPGDSYRVTNPAIMKYQQQKLKPSHDILGGF